MEDIMRKSRAFDDKPKPNSEKPPRPRDPLLEQGLEELSQIDTMFSPYWAVRSLFHEK